MRVFDKDLSDLIRVRGLLRAAINMGNTTLAQRDERTGVIGGISPAIAQELARRMDIKLEFIVYASAGRVFEAADRDEWDIAFLARDPGRTDKLAFSSPYVAVEATYIVRSDSGLRSLEEVDQPGHRVCVTANAAYDHILTRQLKHAEIIRLATPAESLDLFLRNGLEAAAGVRKSLRVFAQAHPDVVVLPGHFARIEQCIAVPVSGNACIAGLDRFLEEMRSTEFVRKALDQSGQIDAITD